MIEMYEMYGNDMWIYGSYQNIRTNYRYDYNTNNHV